MKKVLLLAVFLFLLPVDVLAQDRSTPKNIIEHFFDGLMHGQLEKPFEWLFIGSPQSGDKSVAVKSLVNRTEYAVRVYGKILRYEVVHEEKMGESLYRYVYILVSEKAPTTWEFYFYKPQKDWFLTNLIFNTRFNLIDAKK